MSLKLVAHLPHDRMAEGSLYVTRDGALEHGPFRCRGKADNAAAALHGNPHRSPVRAYGDHPCGVYRAVRVVRFAAADLLFKTYGAAFIALEPLAGDAVLAKRNGRSGLAMHGGALADQGVLRATNGCLRMDNATAALMADVVEAELRAGRVVLYEAAE